MVHRAFAVRMPEIVAGTLDCTIRESPKPIGKDPGMRTRHVSSAIFSQKCISTRNHDGLTARNACSFLWSPENESEKPKSGQSCPERRSSVRDLARVVRSA
jgi:hypothetical protein